MVVGSLNGENSNLVHLRVTTGYCTDEVLFRRFLPSNNKTNNRLSS